MCFTKWCSPIWVLSLFLLVCTLFSPNAFPADHSCPAAISSGQPACAQSRDVGSNVPNPNRSRHVGNPVDVVSGNKYQSEVDVRLGGSQLSLIRHYNSVDTTTNLGLGNGWRHTYSVLLVTAGDDIRRVIQSDGRLVEFTKQGSLYQSLNEDDGYVLMQTDNKHTWHLPDGRVLSFHGSFLTEISFAEGGALTLFYRRLRLHSVTDELGRSIVFRYAPGKISLPAFEPATDQRPSGHLIAVDLPDGSQIGYRYDHRHNLTSVVYPQANQSSDGYRYRYNDEVDSSLLTERSSRQGKVLARWGYNDAGRVISYRKGLHIRADGSDAGAPNLTLSYAAGEFDDSGVTVVTHRNGARSDYQWRLDADRRVIELSEQYTEPPELQLPSSRFRNRPVPLSNIQSAPSYPDDVLTIISMDELGYPNRIHYQSAGESELHQLDVSYNQVGGLLDVDWVSGLIQDVNRDRSILRQELAEFVNNNWAAETNLPEVLSAVAQRGLIETSAKLYLTNTDKALVAGARIRGADLNEARSASDASGQPAIRSRAIGQSPGNTPCSDPLKDCQELLKTRDYAEVSDCAYISSLCGTRFFEADLGKLGVDWADLVDGSFRSGIFYDRDNDEYIVTFAGTKFTSIGDWVSNAKQAFGKQAFQYELAVGLARLLTNENPDLIFKFTGHSLGGGLATAAAAATGRDAIVFNPAALSPDTATNHSFDYANAGLNTEVFNVEGELLTHLQAELEFINEAPGIVHELPRPDFNWVQANVGQSPFWGYNTRLGVALHGMDSIKQSLSELIQRYHCE